MTDVSGGMLGMRLPRCCHAGPQSWPRRWWGWM